MTLHVISGRPAATTNLETLTTRPVIAAAPLAGSSSMQSGERTAATAHGVDELGISYAARAAAATSSRPIAGGWR